MKYKSRTQYSEAFKIEAVKRSIETYGTLRALSEELGIHENLLGRWRKQYLSQTAIGIVALKKTLSPDKSYQELEQENKRLKKALEQAEMDKAILKKAQEYFAEQRRKNTDS